jgi:hypothetical protein
VAIAVYGRLDELLRERNLTVAELKLRIEVQFGLAVDSEALARLTGPDAARQTDMTLAVAATRVLGVSLDDLFASEDVPAYVSPTSDESFLTEEQTSRLRVLQDLHNDGKLSRDELRELDALVDEYGRRVGEYHLSRYAARKGISLEEAQRETDERLAEATAQLKRQDADSHYRQKLIERAKQRRSSTPR